MSSGKGSLDLQLASKSKILLIGPKVLIIREQLLWATKKKPCTLYITNSFVVIPRAMPRA